MASNVHCNGLLSEPSLYPANTGGANTPKRTDNIPRKDTPSLSLQTELDTLLAKLHQLDEELASIEHDLDECIHSRKIHDQPLSCDVISASVLVGLAADVHKLQKHFDDLAQCHQHRFAEARHAYERLRERTANKP